MQTYDLIQKTRRMEPLSPDEITFLVEGFTKGEIPDYMMSAWLMAVCCQGLTPEETAVLTAAMRDSGDCLDLSPVGAFTTDKHSTGGIGDKTTLLVAPIVAACGGFVPKMSGRGLGFTGGTIDKLESIPGFSTSLPIERFLEITKTVGCCVIAQSGDLTPADKKMYALRNLTATVDSIPLICASIMSKKLALGADGILLDVKYGSGAFMKTPEDAEILARLMISAGKAAGKSCRALITDMNAPLGTAVGNALEVTEVIRMLRGELRNSLTELATALAAQMLVMADMGNIVECRKKAEDAVSSGAALEKFAAMIEAQGGDAHVCETIGLLPQAACSLTVKAARRGFITAIQSEEVGLACLDLGAGRTAAQPEIDPGAGVVLHRTVGDFISAGDPLLTVYGKNQTVCETAAVRLQNAVELKDAPAAEHPMIYKIMD
ncbi:MAG: thymidine phosphorylase [Oscillospiraceae bacterium]|jgi:pyrimidine-nucleoside phosphorylase|nr:thymidine phosphorylase [Oscillospiraceae bacterium]